jgi:hypothetical protein
MDVDAKQSAAISRIQALPLLFALAFGSRTLRFILIGLLEVEPRISRNRIGHHQSRQQIHVLPGVFGVALRTVLGVRAEVGVIACMARIAVCPQVNSAFSHALFVTGVTLQPFVRATKTEVGLLIVVESPAIPAVRIVTKRTIRTQAQLVNVVLPMAVVAA